MERSRVLIALGGITVAFAIYGELVNSPFTWIYIGITVLLGAMVWAIDRMIQLSSRSLWGLVAAAIGNLAGGVWLVEGQPLYVYRLFGDMRFDKPAHFFATGMAAWAAYEALKPRLDATPLGLGFVSVMIGTGAGALVEIVEFTASELMENANVGGYTNNMLDLVANLGGAVLVVWLASSRSGPQAAEPDGGAS